MYQSPKLYCLRVLFLLRPYPRGRRRMLVPRSIPWSWRGPALWGTDLRTSGSLLFYMQRGCPQPGTPGGTQARGVARGWLLLVASGWETCPALPDQVAPSGRGGQPACHPPKDITLTVLVSTCVLAKSVLQAHPLDPPSGSRCSLPSIVHRSQGNDWASRVQMACLGTQKPEGGLGRA